MRLSDQDRERYAKIVLGYLDGGYTMDPDDAEHVAEDVIEQYREDQAARQAAIQTVLAVAQTIRREAVYLEDDEVEDDYEVAITGASLDRLVEACRALDATEQEALHE